VEGSESSLKRPFHPQGGWTHGAFLASPLGLGLTARLIYRGRGYWHQRDVSRAGTKSRNQRAADQVFLGGRPANVLGFRCAEFKLNFLSHGHHRSHSTSRIAGACAGCSKGSLTLQAAACASVIVWGAAQLELRPGCRAPFNHRKKGFVEGARRPSHQGWR